MVRSIQEQLFVRKLPLLLGLICTPAVADVTGVSVSQTAQTNVTLFIGGGAPATTFNSGTTSIAFPPHSLDINSQGYPPFPGAEAKQTISAYTGPMSAGAVTPGLVLSGSAQTTYTSSGIVVTNYAYTGLDFVFTLDQMQSYTFNRSGSASLSRNTFNDIPTGQGTLLPGTYTFSAPSGSGVSLTTTFNLVIAAPEPNAALLIVYFGGLAACARRQRWSPSL